MKYTSHSLKAEVDRSRGHAHMGYTNGYFGG